VLFYKKKCSTFLKIVKEKIDWFLEDGGQSRIRLRPVAWKRQIGRMVALPKKMLIRLKVKRGET